MLRLRDYQDKHIGELRRKIEDYLNLESNKTCILKSPTGSGKTIMMAELLKRLADRTDGRELAFIWIAVHKLHDQSKEKLEKYYEDIQTLTCSFFEDLQDKQIQDKEILFFNWHSINQEANIYIRENENEFNLDKVIENTRDEEREIILIIDESHNTAKSERSRDLIKRIGPKITIEVSATPQITDAAYVQSIDLQEVREEEMIKKSVRLNSRIGKIQADTADEIIIRAALDKRLHLKKLYESEGSDVNPLVLIQLPDSRQGQSDRKNQIMDTLDSKFGIGTENGKLAVYLSDKDDKINLENIEKNDNEVEVLIFKQAITVGWDCPRSSVLVLFREWQSFTFSIQTIGRIMRMPEIKHYENDDLNHAFVYTNIANVTIAEDVTKDYMTVYESSRQEHLNDVLDLESTYLKRRHEKTRLTGKFSDIFYAVAKDLKLLDNITLKPESLQTQILVDAKITELDKEQTVTGETMLVELSPTEIQFIFDRFLHECSEGFAPVHSSERIKRALYTLFEQHAGKKDWGEIQQIILSKDNNSHVVKAINHAKDIFRKEIAERISREFEDTKKWNIPENTEYLNIVVEKPYKKCIMSPAYIKTDIENEINFMNFLEEKNRVKWWFKNGEGDKKYFAIRYTDIGDGLPHTFYVDFIVRMEDGRIGLFDPKAGFTAEMAKPKAEALSKYIKSHKSQRLFGGIAVFESGKWLYNDSEKYQYDGRNFSDWKPLELD